MVHPGGEGNRAALSDLDFRLGVPLDAQAFGQANWDWLRWQADNGGPLVPSPQNHRAHMDLFWSYIRKGRDGLVVVYHPKESDVPQGFVLAGEDLYPPRYHLYWGKVANVWLAWTAPDCRRQGVALAMLAWGRPRVRAMGFHHVTCATLQANPAGSALAKAFGNQPYESSWAWKL